MTREQFDELYKDKVVWCKTERFARAFLILANSVNYKWASNASLLGYSRWDRNGEQTVYYVSMNITYGDVKIAKKENYKIVEFTVQPHMYDPEVLAIELKQIEKHLSLIDDTISGLIDVVKVEDLPKVKELREHYETMAKILDGLKGE